MGSTSSFSIKLLINTKEKKVIFAEAGKDFTDFLFSILSMEVSTITSLLFTYNMDMVGSLGKLYESLQNLSHTYLQSNVNKDSLLKSNVSCSSTLFNLKQTHNTYKNCYLESGEVACVSTEYYGPRSPSYVSSSYGHGEKKSGIVKGVVTYMIMDDLEVKPMSAISSISILDEFVNVMGVGALQEKTVSVGVNEGLSLLKASMETKNVLTRVFLGNH
ncbi:hypothetical protein F8388_025748 [Cannabis sativa]|uniref:DUF674 domain-containing protein n=1 Tax=Cannabis sativa TaxID=3483 RepID=A0A7J6EJ52_CANSA|nr:hypothetical protein G4B88_023197 [Cannabis sativa]KAF4367330.1 hypothetical protein F8388_025748 [Cannabis sativa]